MRIVLLIYFLISTSLLLAQIQPIEVFSSSLKISGEEHLYFAFEEGDEIIFNFEELKDKELKEIEISEYGASSKYLEFNISKLENKKIRVSKKSIYDFRFKETALFGNRICKIKIFRIPESDEKVNFNTEVIWLSHRPIDYTISKENTIIGYDTTFVDAYADIVVKDTTIYPLANIESFDLGAQTSKRIVVNLPEEYKLDYWVYSVGVSQASKEQMRKTLNRVSDAAFDFGSKAMGSNPSVSYTMSKNSSKQDPRMALIAYGVGTIASLVTPVEKENVIYAIADNVLDMNNFLANQPFNSLFGKRSLATDYGRINFPKKGELYILLYNDNLIPSLGGIKVDVTMFGFSIRDKVIRKPYKKRIITEITTPKYFHKFIIGNEIKYLEFYEAHKKNQELSNKVKKLKEEVYAHYTSNNFLQALEKSREIASILPNEENLNNLGWYLILNKQYNEAIAVLETGLSKKPDYLYLKGNLAHSYLLANQLERAREIYINYKDHYYLNKESWITQTRKDFETFKKAGIEHQDFETIKNLLGEPQVIKPKLPSGVNEYEPFANNNHVNSVLYETKIVNYMNANFCKEATYTCNQLGIIPSNSQVKVIEKTDVNFYKVVYNNQVGFVATMYLETK